MAINLNTQNLSNVTGTQAPSENPNNISQFLPHITGISDKVQGTYTTSMTSNSNITNHIITQKDSYPNQETQDNITHSFTTGEPLNEDIKLKETSSIKQKILNFFKKNTTSVKPNNIQNIRTAFEPDSPLAKLDFTQVYEMLNTHKTTLGGDEPSNKRFLGISYEACQANIKNALKNKWSPQFFWKLCANYFKVKEDKPCLYTHIKSTLQSIEWVKNNYASLKSISSDEAVKRFENETGQMWHLNQNSSAVFFETINSIAETLNILLFPQNHPDIRLIEHPDSLEVFRKAFSESNCCFPARQRPIMDYYLQCSSGNSQKIDYKTSDNYQALIDKTANDIINESPAEIFSAIKAKLAEQISIHEHDNAKVDKDIAQNLRSITNANIIGYYFVDVMYFDETDLNELLTSIATQQQDGSWKFQDGSSYKFE